MAYLTWMFERERSAYRARFAMSASEPAPMAYRDCEQEPSQRSGSRAPWLRLPTPLIGHASWTPEGYLRKENPWGTVGHLVTLGSDQPLTFETVLKVLERNVGLTNPELVRGPDSLSLK
ncbi:MAG: hypothetical protein R3F61_20190 [Myxococcota bacterium]